MKAKFSLILLLVHVLCVFLHMNNISCIVYPRSKGPPEKYCGPNLSGILDTLCVEYSLPAEYKRSNSIGNNYLSTKHGNPFLNPRYALSSFFRRARSDSFTVSAHDECCEKGCTIAELLQYCKVTNYSVE